MSTNRSDLTTCVDDAIRADFEGPGYWTSQTWLDLFLRSADKQPSALCVADEQAALTRAQVLAAARRLAAYMAHRGIDTGSPSGVATGISSGDMVYRTKRLSARVQDDRQLSTGGFR